MTAGMLVPGARCTFLELDFVNCWRFRLLLSSDIR